MSPLTTLDLSEREGFDPALVVPVDPRLKERNKILKVAMTLVALVAGIAPFLNYLTLEVPIWGPREATLADSFSSAARAAQVDKSPIVQADFLNVRTGPGVEYPAIGQIPKGAKVTVVAKQGGWLKIPTSQGEGWIDGDHVSLPLESMNMWDLLAELDKEGVAPALATGFRRLPPYSVWLPAVALVLVAASLTLLPFACTARELAALRAVLFTWTALSVYALVFHLLLVQAFRNTLGELAQMTATDLSRSQGGLIGALAGVATQAFASNIRAHVGPALYVLAASGALISSLSLFLIPLQRRKVIRPYRDPAEPTKYLDL